MTTDCGLLNSFSWISATTVGRCTERPPLEAMNDAYLTSVLMQVALHKQDHLLSGKFNDRNTWNEYNRVLTEYGYNLQSSNIADFNAFKAAPTATFGEDGLVVVYFFGDHGGNNELVIGFPGTKSGHDLVYTNMLLALSGVTDTKAFISGGETFFAGRSVVEHYETVRFEFLRRIDDILKKSCVRSCVDVIRVIGHSLGGTAAQFGAIDLAKRYAGKYNTWLSTYASPRAFHPNSQHNVHALLTRNNNKANRFMLLGDIVPWGGVGLKHVGNAYFIDMSEGVLQAKHLNYMPDDTLALVCCTTCKMTDNPLTMLALTPPFVPPTATACLVGNHFMSIYAHEIILIRNNNRRYLQSQRRVPARRVTRRCLAFQPTCSDDTRPCSTDPIQAVITSCTASSEFSSNYVCENAFDGQRAETGSRGDAGNAWATKGEGVGSWIELTFDEATSIDMMRYSNRDAFGIALEDSNRQVTLSFSDGSTAVVELIDNT
eukprot:UN21742